MIDTQTKMWRFAFAVIVLIGAVSAQTSDQLVESVLNNCVDINCVKLKVLGYFDGLLHVESDGRTVKDVDEAIFARGAKVLKKYEFRFQLPQVLFGQSQVTYNAINGLDIVEAPGESRGLLKKKLLLPILLLLKLKMKALMPIFVALIGLKSLKALILSKLAIGIVLGFIVYQFLGKSGMPMPMSMGPIEPPTSLYGPPTTGAPNSYEPSWEPNSGGPYSRVWSPSEGSGQNIAYSAYYPGSSTSSP